MTKNWRGKFDKEFGNPPHILCEGFVECICREDYLKFIETLLQEQREMIRKEVEVALDFVERHNKKDEEREVAEAAQKLEIFFSDKEI